MKIKLKYLWSLLLVYCFLFPGKEVYCQTAYINLGNYQLDWLQNAQFVGGGYSSSNFTGVWPGGWYRRGTIGWYGIGTTYDKLLLFRNGIDATSGVDTARQSIEYAPEVDVPVRPLREVRKYKPPTVIVDGIPDKPYKGGVDRNLPTAQLVETISKTGWGRGGSWFDIKVYAFDNPKYSDFVILDFKMIMKMDFDRVDTLADGPTNQTIRQWFSPIFAFSPTQYGYEQSGEWWPAIDTWTDYIIRPSNLVPPGTSTRDSLLISYACDSNNPTISGPSNLGDPLSTTGELVSPQYTGFAVLYADKSPTERQDDITEPMNVTTGFIDDMWTDEPTGSLFTWATTPGREHATIGTPSAVDPNISYDQLGRMSYEWLGPYDMTYNDTVRFVIALGAGGIDPLKAISLGKDWKDGLVTDAEKDSIVATGLDSLFNTLDKAKWAWNNYLKTGDFGIPWPLPAPDLKVTSGPGWNTLEWGYPDNNMFRDSRTGVDDFKEWRVYQKRGDYMVDHPNDNSFQDYHLVFSTTDRNITSYKDTSAIRGVSYHYFVTALDNDGNESSRFANRTLYAASTFKAGEESSTNVKIVPNPYIINAGALNFSDPNEIKFFNLPPYCNLRIYNEVGDLIKEIRHVSGSGDETWNQLTSARQYVASGVYILAVQNARNLSGGSLPDKIYKFVIVR